MKPRRTPSNNNINDDNTDFSPVSSTSGGSKSPSVSRRTASSPVAYKNGTDDNNDRNLSPSRGSRLSRASSSSSLKSSSRLTSPDSAKSSSKYLIVGGPGSVKSSGSGGSGEVEGVGEGNLTMNHIGVVNTSNLFQPPELLIAEPSPTLPNNAEAFPSPPPLLPVEDSIASTSKSDFHHAASYDNIPSQYRSTSLPPVSRTRATTLSDGSGRPSGLVALAGINSSPSPSLTESLAPSSLYSGRSAVKDNGSRPTSRSGSVNSQQYPDSLHPTSASSSRKNTLLQQQPLHEPTSSSASSFMNMAMGTKNIKKARSNGGIAGALALSGVALASPSASLRQPLSLATRGTSYHSISNSSTPNGNKSPSPSIMGGGGGGRYSLDGQDGGGSEAGESNYGEHGFMSMDQLGDFDDVVSQLGSGYAVASSKRNTDFHAIFKNIPDDDYLIEDYGCAMQREILIQGRLYISEHHLSFNANIFGWVTSLTLPFAEIVSIEKRMTAYVIPNAIQITTLHARHTFASFLSRDTTYDLIVNIWRMIHPVIPSSALPDSYERQQQLEHTHDYSTNSTPQDSPIDGNNNLETGGGAEGGGGRVTTQATRPNISNSRKQSGRNLQKEVGKVHEVTIDRCPTLKNLKEVCMDTVFPSAPEKIYNLMYTSGFMKEFWSKTQKLLELQISDWAPEKSGSNTLARTISYIKPLNGSIGPRQTKCLLTDENAHVDFEDYVCVITTTRTPDVPSGSAFSVKTRTSMTWAKGNSCRVVVTTGVEWTKSSFIKGIIERSCMEGQRSSYVDLEKAMRAYIHQHRSEFLEEGQEPDTTSLAETSSIISTRDENQPSSSTTTSNHHHHQKKQTEIRTLRTGEGKSIPYLRPFIEIGTSIFDLIGDLVGEMSIATGALVFIVVILVLSNIWTLSSSSSTKSNNLSRSPSSSITSNMRGGRVSSNPDEVASAVRSVLQDYFAGIPGTVTSPVNEEGETGEFNPEWEMKDITTLLDNLEARIVRLRGNLVNPEMKEE